MRILESTLHALVNGSPAAPPEVGGLLGGHDGVVDTLVFDPSADPGPGNRYSPHTDRLNRVLIDWHGAGVDFIGIFHTHFPFGYGLSPEDEGYIARILTAMPPSVVELHFPVVIPGHGAACFRAMRVLDAFHIEEDAIIPVQHERR